ncbi:hypothetical protein H7H78_06050 [Mycobacterium shinjukuense]|uniref:Uncharacterized protein n=1 Tax=Mycobacterium shinjukuense TaxID=398694 RepID=A0A7I7MSF3_9MYCO|nr:hypothetical protein [Mycobacterium shinjukuense]MCV6985022.1 hypothetical protein [Mycobacterium shinjukuense]ORB69329.1 hypothetical protein BST45_09670 [Mycobacterium shinjukuense]BBX74986.1 hypothetical protein MSHI_28920 [Mycobacterium shinjukuense]
MSAWFNYTATLKILIFSLLAGAALPALFAFGVRLAAVGAGGVDGGAPPRRRPVLLAISWAIYALVFAVVVIGVLYIARDFIAEHTGWLILGAKRA